MIRLLGIKDGLAFYIKAKRGSLGEINASNWHTSFNLRPGTTDFDTYEHVFVLKEYEIDLPFVPKLIIDGGANNGMSAIFFALKYPSANIISVEPNKDNFRLLQHNTRDFKNVTAICKGVWNESGFLKIINSDADSNAFRVDKINSNEDGAIPAVSISDLLMSEKAAAIDILKLDIEGAEKKVFESNYESWLPKTRLLIIELHDKIQPGSSKALFNAISNYNFTCETKWENLLLFNNDLT